MILFAGLERAHGIYVVKKKTASKQNKIEGTARTVLEPVTVELWKAHLEGKTGLGIIPIREDNTCYFGAIDIDTYPLDLVKLETSIKILKLPLMVGRTKSGGAHLYLFMSEPVTAKLIRDKLAEWAMLLGYGSSEIFPKQTKLASDQDVGNWINMPYFKAGKTTRYIIYKGKALTAEDFLKYAIKRRIKKETLINFSVEEDEKIQNGPPCLVQLVRAGIPAGNRNTSLFNLGVYCRLRYGDEWQKYIDELNGRFLSPALSSREVQVIIKSLSRKAYFYTCDSEPLKSICNKGVCQTKKYGIGNDTDSTASFLELKSLTKICTDPPIWIVDVDGVRMELATKVLLRQEQFRMLCVEKINQLPPRVKAARWEKMIEGLLANVIEVEAPADAGAEGLFWQHLRHWCTGPTIAKTKAELLAGKIWIDEKANRTYFRVNDLIRYLNIQRFFTFDQRELWNLIRRSGCGGHETFKIKGVSVDTWWVVSFEEQDSDFDIPEHKEDM